MYLIVINLNQLFKIIIMTNKFVPFVPSILANFFYKLYLIFLNFIFFNGTNGTNGTFFILILFFIYSRLQSYLSVNC